MSKVAIVYWSGTGNTEQMAKIIEEAVNSAGSQAELFTPDSVSSSLMNDYDAYAFGCPSMGDEVLEESEFEPMFEGLEDQLGGKKVVLFGSYGWGDGQWMREWEERVEGKSANVLGTVIANEAPDDEATDELKAIGKQLAG